MALFLPRRWRRQPPTFCALSSLAYQTRLAGWWPATKQNFVIGGNPFIENSTYTAVSVSERGYSTTNGVSVGGDDYATASIPASVNMAGQWSYFGWFKPGNANADWCIGTYGSGSFVPYFYWQLGLETTTSKVYFKAYGGVANNTVTSSAAATVGQWSQIGVSYNAGTVNLYLNGKNIATGSAATGQRTEANGFHTLYTGKPVFAPATPYYGDLQNVALFASALTDSHAKQLYDEPWSLGVFRRPVFFIGGPAGVVGSAKSAGGGATKATGATTRAGAAKSAGGGATKATGVTTRVGSAKSAGGGAAKSQGTSVTPTVGSAKAAGGGASGSVGATARTGTATSSGGGSARAQGAAAVLHTAAAAGGGAAIPAGRGSPGHTSVGSASAGGGAARAIGVQNVGILGTARAAGGGCAISPTLANRIGWAVAGGGGAARATAQSATHSGTARAAGGGAARAFGATTPPPSNVDHYIHGWPVSQSGAVIVRIMP